MKSHMGMGMALNHIHRAGAAGDMPAWGSHASWIEPSVGAIVDGDPATAATEAEGTATALGTDQAGPSDDVGVDSDAAPGPAGPKTGVGLTVGQQLAIEL